MEALQRKLPTDPTILAVAEELNLNVRTLQRRLATAGISYRRLLDEYRYQRAVTELAETANTVSEVAQRLGYSDAAHFARAFRRWTGVSPRAFANRTPRR